MSEQRAHHSVLWERVPMIRSVITVSLLDPAARSTGYEPPSIPPAMASQRKTGGLREHRFGRATTKWCARFPNVQQEFDLIIHRKAGPRHHERSATTTTPKKRTP
ncbi:uncharacterized protein PV07_08817 [Cladophialophora immunda]|uniref:Uncharacterized protein n=1 Tax=Cladophialophora immunda TaxID=569365 RepID=A0A0D2C5A7_9EURO|nr:uncharacterized protein PV07_08817 [Cladophialophora immunda]KIW25655.1 hypothetical protein PV07_08817 [Cladophialophora immunda]